MEKFDIEVSLPKIKRIEFQEKELFIDPYVSLSSRNSLISNYLEIMLDESKSWTNRYLLAKHTFIMEIVDLNTSVDVSSLTIDKILGSGLWDKIKNNIVNLPEVESEVFTVVKYAIEDKYQEKSIGFSFDKISVRVSELLDKILDTDLSKEGVAELFRMLDAERNKINEILSHEPQKTKRKPKLS